MKTPARSASSEVRSQLCRYPLRPLYALSQAHSFIGLGMLIGTYFLLDAHKWLADPRLLGAWIAAGVVALVIGGPQIAMFSTQVRR